ncbi:MAG: lamin tail domain-containing protein [Saprospiraceae bacterium]|nr:lamin tail domain-containing protein [Saprospiraceae bacterium]
MKRMFTLGLFMLMGIMAQAQIIISEIYGGATTTSPYSCDYVVIQNIGAATVDIGGYRIYYGSGSNSNAPALSVTITAGTMLAPGASYVIQLACTAGNTNPSTPYTVNQTGSTNIGSTAGRVYLTNAVAPDNACSPTNTLGAVFYGTQTVCTSNAPAPSSTTSIVSTDGVVFTTKALPILLNSFSVKQISDKLKLTWQTASETNNQYFAIERSTDNRAFYQIGKVDGTGTSQTTNVYSFTDEQPLRGVNYYRLRQVDFDGVATYSEVKSLLFSEKGSEVTLYPNPVASSLTVVLGNAAETGIRAAIYDAYGRLINTCTIPAGTQVHTIDTNTLPTGTYTLVLNGELLQSTQRFTKQ